MEMMNLPQDLALVGEVELENAVAEFLDCGYIEAGSQYTSNGTLKVNGSYDIVEDGPQMTAVKLIVPFRATPLSGPLIEQPIIPSLSQLLLQSGSGPLEGPTVYV